MSKNKRKPPKTIYFTKGHATEEDYAAAEKIGMGVVFRRGDLIVPEDPLEEFDAVAGDVPEVYAVEAERRAILAGENPPQDAPKLDPSTVQSNSPIAPTLPAGAATPTPNPAPAWKPNA